MARSEKQKQKLFRILELLIRRTDEEYGVSMPEIIAFLEEAGIKAERKSIYDDLITLGEIGFEVEKLDTHPPRYTLSRRIFELGELKMLVDAVQSSRFISAEKCREIISKLEFFAGERHSRELSRQVYVEDRVRSMNKSSFYNIDTLHFAINNDSRITFKYFDYNIDKERVFRHGGALYQASPCALLWNDQNYYLAAYDETARVVKNFRVDKMQNITVLDEPRSSEAEAARFNSADYSQKIFGMYGGKEELVTLECSPHLAGVIIDRFGTEPTLIKTERGFRVSLRVMLSPNFYAWVFGFGSDMKIISPTSARDELIALAENILNSYK